MTSYYTEIREIPNMTQEELANLYEQEGIYKTDLDSLIRDVKKELARLGKRTQYVESKGKLKNRDNLLSDYKERKENLRSQLSKLCHNKCYRFVRSMSMIVRSYPSQELINTIVEAHLYLAYNYASIYSKKTDCDRSKHSFDDLYQLAAESLIYAAKQYVPGGKATFVTYARRCIENRLNKEIYGEKKKKTIKVDYLTIEFERMLLARKLLLNLSDENIFMPNDDLMRDEEDDIFAILLREKRKEQKKRKPFAGFFKLCNKDIRLFNKKMARCFEETMPHIKEEHPIKDFLMIYQKLISSSLIDKVLTDDDKWIIRESFHHKTNASNKAILLEVNRIEFYLHKLAQIQEALAFEKEYMKKNDGLKPSEEEIYAHLSKRIKEMNKASKTKEGYCFRKFYISNLETYTELYYTKYKIKKGALNKGEQRRREIKKLFIEFEERYRAIISKEEQTRTEEEREFLRTYCKDGKRNAKEFIYDSIRKRKKDTRAILHQDNISMLNSYHYYRFLLPRICFDDVKSVYKSIAIIQSLDEFEQERGPRVRSTRLTPEEQMLENETIRVYQEALDGLPEEEKEVLRLMITSNGLNQHSIKEIAEVLCITEKEARSLGDKGKRKLRKNNQFKEYLNDTAS